MALADKISPSYVGEEKIVLTLSATTPLPRAFDEVVVDIDYSKTLPAGVSLPLIFRAVDPAGRKLIERVLRRLAPTELSFRPISGGLHLIWLAEAAHHRWFGALRIDVAGDAARK